MLNWHLAAVSAAMITSSTIAMTTPDSPMTRESVTGSNRTVGSCAETLDTPQRLRIRIVPGAPAAVVAQARAEVDAIWRQYQVAIEWIETRVESAEDAESPDLFVYFVDQKMAARTAKRSPAIAWIPFTDGVPMHFVRVSWPAAMALLETKSWYDGQPLARAQSRVRDEVLGRIVGRALAHEIGHYLLASQTHALGGLMRAALTNSELVTPGLGRLKLEDAEMRQLRAARVATCETMARSSAGTR